ncbi:MULTISPECIES: hypothetical protein [Peptostreptococcales]|uniref:hypothetical protein n=1 Tax=Peptostreptococcales TaxID=3082720 RepID=UPI000E4C4C7B|nr:MULTISPECIES: hypothetical protein [Peptostreptococcaceae]RHQ97955.1 hypothetical protein DWX74_06090 [Peptoclostridium sp. AF21-18]
MKNLPVDLKNRNSKLETIKKESRRVNVIPIEQLFENYNMSNYEPSEVNWGEDIELNASSK